MNLLQRLAQQMANPEGEEKKSPTIAPEAGKMTPEQALGKLSINLNRPTKM